MESPQEIRKRKLSWLKTGPTNIPGELAKKLRKERQTRKLVEGEAPTACSSPLCNTQSEEHVQENLLGCVCVSARSWNGICVTDCTANLMLYINVHTEHGPASGQQRGPA